MADRFCRRPKQNSNCDRGANRDRKPVPQTHQWFRLGSPDADVAESRAPEASCTDQNAQHHCQKSAAGKQPAKIIEDPVISPVNRFLELAWNDGRLALGDAICIYRSCI